MRRRTLGTGIALAALISLSLAAPAVAGTAGAAGAAKDSLAGHAAGAAASAPGVLPPQPAPLGVSYGQWNARWWQWFFQTPRNVNPEFSDPGTAAAPVAVDCSAGQSGHVWFLGGTFQPTGTTATGPLTDVYRTCSVPTGTFLFFPVLNDEYDNLCPKADYTAKQLTDAAALAIDDIVPGSMSATIDGAPVSGLADGNSAYRAPSPWFSFTLPPGNISPDLGCPYPAGTMPPTVDGHPGVTADGIYLMQEPLSPGVHVIRWRGEIKIPADPPPAPPSGALDFTQNINYTITVTPR